MCVCVEFERDKKKNQKFIKKLFKYNICPAVKKKNINTK